MILQTTEIEYVDNPMILVLFFSIFSFIILFFILETYSRFREKIHHSYHKGYNQATDDNLKYYDVIRQIKDDFLLIMNELDKCTLTVDIVKTLIKFGNTLLEYQQK